MKFHVSCHIIYYAFYKGTHTTVFQLHTTFKLQSYNTVATEVYEALLYLNNPQVLYQSIQSLMAYLCHSPALLTLQWPQWSWLHPSKSQWPQSPHHYPCPIGPYMSACVLAPVYLGHVYAADFHTDFI